MATDKKIRVLIADDSAFMRKVLQSIITSDAQMEVVGEARDGKECVAQAESLKPDVITMDINMPHMDGLQATEIIMSANPRPILIVSSESRDGAHTTLKALELGAIDFVAKPSSGIDLDMNSVREELGRKLRMAAKVRVVRTATRSKLQHEVATAAPRGEAPSQMAEATAASSNSTAALRYKPAVPASAMVVPAPPAGKGDGRHPVVVVASSTGGPAALMKFVPMFSRSFPGVVLIVQHMPGTFTRQFSKQLAEASAIRVKEAESGEAAEPRTVYICPGSHHLRLSASGRIMLDDGPRISGYRPSADLALETAAAYAGPMTIGVVLTGMGNDGSHGILAVKDAGGFVIAQDESTSIIFGMPSEAIKTGAVDQVLAIENIYAAIEKRVLYVHGAARVGAL